MPNQSPPMADTMIERIARVLCAREGRDPDEVCIGEGAATGRTWTRWQAFATEADDVLAAMREPTFEMIAACGDLIGSQQEHWKRSIDAARAGA